MDSIELLMPMVRKKQGIQSLTNIYILNQIKGIETFCKGHQIPNDFLRKCVIMNFISNQFTIRIK